MPSPLGGRYTWLEAKGRIALLTNAQSGSILPSRLRLVYYNAVPSPLPPNVPSVGFQCCATAEFGDRVQLEAAAPRTAGFATVVLSDWAKHSDYPTMTAAGFMHPITLNFYSTSFNANAHAPDATVTQTFLIPWRPEADPSCGTAWRSPVDNQCYNGLAFPISF
jgi:hypothetical protein